MHNTALIKLRPFDLNDAKKVAELRLDSNAVKSFAGSPFPSNLESEKEWISNMYPSGLRSTVYFAVEETVTGDFIGYCVARKIDYINSNAEFGIILNYAGRGKGYAKEILRLFFTYLFNELHLYKIYSLVLVENTIAMELYKKMGFHIEGEIKEHLFQSGKYQDLYFISLYANEYSQEKNQPLP